MLEFVFLREEEETRGSLSVHVRTQREGDHLQARERALRGD